MAEPTGTGDGGDHPRPTGDERTLSVVVITHNEGERIGDCLESVFAACEPIDRFEVVLVDSRSTDGTLGVAREFPVTVLELPADPAPTPGAGRYVGTSATRGDLVLFVDGDMVLTEGWLESACGRVRGDPTLGGVDGHLNDSTADAARPMDVLRGVVLYDRGALADAGGFDPHLRALEDIDVSYRVADEGYRLLRLPDVVADHPFDESGAERVRRWENGYYHGRGQLYRKYLSRPRLLGRLAYRTRLHLAILAWTVIGAVGTAVAGRRAALAWAVGAVVGFAGLSRMRSAGWTVDKLLGCVPVYAGTALGFPGKRPRSTEYPIEAVETRKSAPPAGGGEVRAS